MAQETQILTLEVQAKIDDAIAKVQTLTNAIKELQGTTGQATFIQIQGGIKKTGDSAQKATTQVDKLRERQEALARTNKAGAYTLLQFNRVVADAPFGILGIANNIDGLIQALQNLSATSQGAGGSLRAIGRALVGPAGIALAVTALTSTLIKFGPQISEAIIGLGKFEKASSDAFGEATKSGEAARIELLRFSTIANDTTLSVERQKKAFEGANKIAGNFGLAIKNLNTFQAKSTEILPILTQLTFEKAKADALAAAAADLYAKDAKRVAEFMQGDIFSGADGILGKLSIAWQGLLGSFGGTSEIAIRATTEAFRQNDEQTKKTTDLIGKLEEQTVSVQKNLNKLTEDAKKSGLFIEDFGDKTKKTKKTLEELRDELDQIYAPNDTRLKESIRYQVTEADTLLKKWMMINKELDKRKQKSSEESVKVLVDQVTSIPSPPANIASITQLPSAIQDVIRELENAKISGDAFLESLNEDFERVSGYFDLINPAIEQAFNALANGQDTTDALNQALKRLIVQLALAAIKAAVLAAIMATITPGGAAAANAAGFGFSDLLSKFLGLTTKRAGGGFLRAGQLATVGEVGRELFVPQTSGTIVPNSQLGGGQIIPTIEFGYDRLRIGFDRSQRRAGRTL